MFVILGSTGDLCKKKVFPALNAMLREKLDSCTRSEYIEEEIKLAPGSLSSSSSILQQSPLSHANPENPRNRNEYLKAQNNGISVREINQKNILRNSGVYIPPVIAYARSKITTEELIRRIDPNIEYLKEMINSIEYVSGPYENMLSQIETHIQKHNPKQIYMYMAVPPTVYPCIIDQVKKSSYKIVLLAEKPFGTSLESFKQLKAAVEPLKERFLCIDHYLFKRVLIQMPLLLEVTALKILKPETVKQIDAYFNEVDGVKGRLGYFAHAGMCRDVLQSHLLVAIATILGGRDKKSILSCIKPLEKDNTTIGEYKGYKEEIEKEKIEGSICETYIKTETEIVSPWNIPLKMECGKKMKTHFVGVNITLSAEGVKKVLSIEIGKQDYENTKKIKRIPMEKIKGVAEISLTPKEYVKVSLYYKKTLLKRLAVPLSDNKGHTPYHAMLNQILYENNIQDNFSTINEVEMQWKIIDSLVSSLPEQRIIYGK